jgi:hypothetical protein
MTTLAAIRPDSWNFPLFLHVLGAMLLVGTLLAVVSAIVLGWRSSEAGQSTALTRFGLWTLALGVFPSYVLMRVGAEWIGTKEFPGEVEEPDWIGVGYITADAGALLIVICLVLAGIGLRRLRANKGVALGRAVAIIAALLLAAYLVAVWAMTTKPGA